MWNARVVNEKCRSFILFVVECILQMCINVLLLYNRLFHIQAMFSKKLHIEAIAHVCIDVLLVCKNCLSYNFMRSLNKVFSHQVWLF